MEVPTHRGASEEGVHRGLAYLLWLPDPEVSPPPWPGVVILHGAGSRKENHADFARLASSAGWAALSFDARGHGSSEGGMSPAAVADVLRMVRFLAATEGIDHTRIALRGSSMGGFLAIHTAAISDEIAGVIAICPANEQGLLRGLRQETLEMRVEDRGALEAWLGEHNVRDATEEIGPRPLILLHAEGDQSIPLNLSEEIYERALGPRKLIKVPGGSHRSVQHDEELQTTALRWLERQIAADRV
jgi:alpha-beta hydrolase superfamily lysophospholipase